MAAWREGSQNLPGDRESDSNSTIMLKNSLLAFTALCATATVASAEDEVTPTPTPAPTPMAPSGGGPFTKSTLGLSVSVPGISPGYLMDIVYFLSDKAAIDILGGIVFTHAPGVPATATTPAGSATNAFGFSIGAGYRMYTHKGQVIHTYIQPYGLLSSIDVGNAGDNFALQVGANFGAEAFVNDWLSFRGQVGAAIGANSTAGNTLATIALATTTGLFANVYWK
jgi:hypothetical protein